MPPRRTPVRITRSRGVLLLVLLTGGCAPPRELTPHWSQDIDADDLVEVCRPLVDLPVQRRCPECLFVFRARTVALPSAACLDEATPRALTEAGRVTVQLEAPGSTE